MNNVISNTDEQSFNQHTLKDSFSFIGIGLHSGLKSIVSAFPAEANTGYTFVRRDVMSPKITARWNNVIDTHLNTTIGNHIGTRVSTIEHLLAALYANGVDNAHIVLDAPEVPIIDGCASAFVTMINKIGLEEQDAPRKAIVVTRPIFVKDGDKSASIAPESQLILDVEIDFDHPVIGHQKIEMPLTRSLFNTEIASARTFGFEEQVKVLRELGYCKGGSIKNAVLVGKDTVINKEGLRFTDEFVRHKYLDAVGDLALLGARVLGKYTGRSSGHKLNNNLLHALMNNTDAWFYTTLENAHTHWSSIVDDTIYAQ